MISLSDVPEVSVISSWSVPNCRQEGEPSISSLQDALREGINLLDLYFLDHYDIPWYAKVCDVSASQHHDPHNFAASLSKDQLHMLEERLRFELTDKYQGRLVGRRPRFGAIATFFPNISHTENGKRHVAVQAIRNTLFLAYLLGCRCVEIVGGAGVPGDGFTGNMTPKAYHDSRMAELAKSIKEIYDLGDDENPLNTVPLHRLPSLAVELEPGYSFLLRSLKDFTDLLDEVKKIDPDGIALNKTLLNVDVAHAFLIGYGVDEIRNLGLEDRVAHMHISDHGGDFKRGGSHAVDLPPGMYHQQVEYDPWLKFAIHAKNTNPNFSGMIAIEMEAVNNPDEIIAAINVTRRWLLAAGENYSAEITHFESAARNVHRGALLVVDIGHSTEELLTGNTVVEQCMHLTKNVEKLCRVVLEKGGSVMSFTGDGVIAIFEDEHYSNSAEVAKAAVEVAERVTELLLALIPKITIRAALHWGDGYIPNSGQLRDQIIGPDVVCASRLCDWLGKVYEPAQDDSHDGVLVAATAAFLDMVAEDSRSEWGPRKTVDFKGLPEDIKVYRRKKVT
jgi:class 3 adenylate cyclase